VRETEEKISATKATSLEISPHVSALNPHFQFSIAILGLIKLSLLYSKVNTPQLCCGVRRRQFD
jgi:hypothetical protein